MGNGPKFCQDGEENGKISPNSTRSCASRNSLELKILTKVTSGLINSRELCKKLLNGNEMEGQVLKWKGVERSNLSSQRQGDHLARVGCDKIHLKPQRGIIRRIISVVIVILLVFLLLYLFTTNILVASSDVRAKQLHIADMHVKYKTKEDLALLDANVTLRVTFVEKGILKLSPKLATFNISSSVVNHQHISAVSSSTFKITKDEQLMVLRFKHETRLTEEEMQDFQKKMHDGSLLIKLSGDLKWHVKNSRLLVFGNNYQHTHISCEIMYANVLKNDLHLAVCHLNL